MVKFVIKNFSEEEIIHEEKDDPRLVRGSPFRLCIKDIDPSMPVKYIDYVVLQKYITPYTKEIIYYLNDPKAEELARIYNEARIQSSFNDSAREIFNDPEIKRAEYKDGTLIITKGEKKFRVCFTMEEIRDFNPK
jgi:hypothetical protein